HRRARQHGGLADFAAQLEAVGIRQHDIEQDQVGLPPFQLLERALLAGEDLGEIALASQIIFEQRGQLRLILDNCDLLRHPRYLYLTVKRGAMAASTLRLMTLVRMAAPPSCRHTAG